MIRHERWTKVDPGHVIPAGQPYRVEWDDGAAEAVGKRDFPASPNAVAFVDSLWRPPLELPTEPTWGIAIHRDYGILVDEWHVEKSSLTTDSGREIWCVPGAVLDFIPLTDEQAARLEAAR